MSKHLIFNLLLFLTIIPASIPTPLTLLAAISSNNTFDPLEMRALSSIANSHPELSDYEVMDIYDDSAPNGTESNYFVTMKTSNTSILVAVSFLANDSNYFVSFTQVPNRDNNQTAAINSSNMDRQMNDSNWISSLPPPPPHYKMPFMSQSQKTFSPQYRPPPHDSSSPYPPPRSSFPPPPQNAPTPPNNNQSGIYILGGYQLLPSLSDARLAVPQSYLLSLHPNLVNYNLQYVEYQVVTGINYLMFYSGIDKFTNLMAKVYVDLDGVANLIAFKVTCAVPSTECSNKIAGDVFNGVEHVLDMHPQMRSYGLISVDIEEQSQNSLSFMATFQNQKLKMRAIAELRIAKTTEILSFYSYRYS